MDVLSMSLKPIAGSQRGRDPWRNETTITWRLESVDDQSVQTGKTANFQSLRVKPVAKPTAVHSY